VKVRAIEVLVVGSLNMDLTAFAPRLPLPGETLMGTGWATANGGKGGNQAVAAARLGARVAMIGRVGRDAHGEALRAALIAEGIECDAINTDPLHPTGVALITVDSRSQNTIVVIAGSNAEMSSVDIDAQRELFAAATIVLFQLETPLPSVRRGIELAAELGKFVILNPAPAPERAILDEEMLTGVTLLVPNETEAAQLSQLPVTSVEEAILAAQELRTRGCREVIVTLGALGVVHVGRSEPRHYPARATQALDTTAAGDTFIGGLAASLARGDDLTQAIYFGQLAASLSVSRPGAQSSIPTLAEVSELRRRPAPS
jgi:ribokinase